MLTCIHICWSRGGRRWAQGRRRDSCRAPLRSRPGRPSAASSDRSRAAAASTPGPPSPAASVLPVWLKVQRGIFLDFSTGAPKISPCRRMLGSNPGQLRLRHWLSDALTTRQDLIPALGRISSTTRLDLIQNLNCGRKTQEEPNKSVSAAEPKNEVEHIKEFLSMFLTWNSFQASDLISIHKEQHIFCNSKISHFHGPFWTGTEFPGKPAGK